MKNQPGRRPVQHYQPVLLFAIPVFAFGLMDTENLLRGQQDSKQPAKRSQSRQKKNRPFRWVNPLPSRDGNRNNQPGPGTKKTPARPGRQLPPGLKHATFRSPSMNRDVGYCIYLPPEYDKPELASKRFPVVYYLHGGRPGNETKSVGLTVFIDQAMRSGKIPSMIYVFVNGGKVSHYNMPQFDSMGADVFIKELIPHIDATYRTIARREMRGLEGFSQGGRGTTRLMFRYPNLFYSCAPGGAGYATEKKISENHGRESENLVFAEGDNTWDLARRYARTRKPELRILIHVGTKGFNYENNLQYMEFLKSLKIPFERLVVPDVPHSAYQIYQKQGLKLMQFHATNFGLE